MLKSIINIYLLSGTLLYILLLPSSLDEYKIMTIFVLISFFSYFSILNTNYIYTANYSNTYLIFQVLFYIILFIILENSISYFYNNDFFVFSKSDALLYHKKTMQIINMPFIDAIRYYLKDMDTDDLGIILILYPLYLVFQSNIILNLFYIFIGILTAITIFSLSQNFTSKRYSFFASISYATASFVLFFHATGLKESFMVLLIILSFDFYYKFLKNKNLLNLILSISILSTLLLFRPAILGMIVISIVLGHFFSKKRNIILLLSIIGIIVVLLLFSPLNSIINSYTTGGYDTLIKAREAEGMIVGSLPLTYAVTIISQTIGPLPTIYTKLVAMFYAPSLIFRVFLGFPFWFGVFYAFNNKKYSKIYPLIIFALIEMFALIYLIDGLELRFTMPQMPIIYIVAFWFLDRFDNEDIEMKNRPKIIKIFKYYIILSILLISYWNLR